MSDETRKIQLATELDTRPVKEGFKEIVQAAEGTATGVQNAAGKAGKAVDGIGNNADAAAKKIEVSERSIIASIQRRTAAVQAAGQSESKYYEELAKQRGVNVEALRPYLAQLDAAKAKQDAASVSLGGMGMSAKATAAALRGVPAQFTDIATSLASGQAPLTVFLQQGGQLKDMFGGAGNAARALGGYVLGLINPITIATSVVAAFGVAAYQGSGELQAFNRALILNGNTAGVTSDRLMGVASSIKAANDSITQSKAAAALNLMVDAGVRGESQLGRYAKAAIEFEKAGGSAATTVAKNFEELGKNPLQASLKLSESMGYLSSSVVETIRSLESQGRTVDAARLAQSSYADALESRTPMLVENIGYLEGAWKKVAGQAAQAWDTMLGLGRQQSLSEQFNAAGQRIASARAHNTLGAGNGFDVADPRRGADERLMASLRRQMESQAVAADMTAQQAQKEKERVAFLGQAEKYLTSEQRQQREILSVKNLVTRQIISQEEAEKRIAAIRAQGAKKPTGSRGREGDQFAAEREAAKGWADAYGDFGRIAREAEGGMLGLSRAQQRLVEFLQNPAYQNASQPMRELALQQAYVAIEAEKTAAALKAELAANEAVFNAMTGRINAQNGIAVGIEEQARQQREATAAYGLSGAALLELETARLLDAAAERERQAVVADGMDLSGALGQAYRDEALALRDLAAAKKNDAAVRQQVDQYRAMWEGVEGFAQSAFVDIAMNGEDAFKRIGQSIKKEVIQLLYEMTVKKWIIQIAGQSSGLGSSLMGQGGNTLTNLVSDWLGNYFGGGAAAAGGASVYGTSYAAASVSDAAMISTGSKAAAGGTASSSLASGGFTGYGYLGYAALIAAAVVVADGLYERGWNRAALGDGGPQTTKFGQYSEYTSDPNMGRSAIYDYGDPGLSKQRREIMDAVGFSSKWADILSGTVRMAHLFGRQLKEVGLQASVSGGNATVSGYTFEKGGVFRGNRTRTIEADPRDAANFDLIVESTINGSRAMARAMGLSEEAINAYTGSIKVNFKGAKTAEEQSKRMAEALDNLNFELLKAASGGKLAREDFKAFMEGIQKDIQQAGINSEGIADVLVAGMTGRLSGADVGAQLSEIILGGIYNAIAGSAAAQISQLFMTQIITPIFAAIASGVPIAQAVSAAAIQQTVATARQYMEVVKATFNDPEFRAFLEELKAGLNSTGAAAASVAAPAMRTYAGPSPAQTAAEEAKREKEQLERELLRLQGNTAELRRRELLDVSKGNRALQERIWALEDEQRITQERNELERQRLDILGDTAALRALERDALDESNRALYDEIQALKDAAELKNVWRDLTDSIEDEIKRIRGEVLGDSVNGLSYVQAQFATLTAQARALDQEAASKLPDLAGQLRDLYQTNSGSRADFEYQVSGMLASLEETNRITRSAAGVTVTASAVEDKALGKKVDELSAAVVALQGIMQKAVTTTTDTTKLLDRVTGGGNAMRTTTV